MSPSSANANRRLRQARTALWHLRKGGVRQVREWWRRGTNAPSALDLAIAPKRRESPTAIADTMPKWPLPHRSPRLPSITVATIMDEFSADAWRNEFTVIEITPASWRTVLDEQQPDLLFVESAWAGSQGAWRYQLLGSKAPSAALRQAVAAFQAAGIPTVFWNKEDPPHYEEFLETARLFDTVFSTDAGSVERYKQDLGHNRVDVLGFAAQPTIHNPVRMRGYHQERDIVFGGTYFSHKFPERRAQMDLVLGAAAEVAERRGLSFDIFSRFQADEKYRFPSHLERYVRGSLDYRQMLTAYRHYKVLLNVNSVVDSETMLARRVFETLACGTPVLSTRSPAVEHWFGEHVQIVDTAEEAKTTIRALVQSPELRDRIVHRAQRHIWQQHTFAHRAQQVLRAAGIDRPVRRPSVTILAPTIRPELVETIIRQAGSQADVDAQLLILTHGFAADERAVARWSREYGIETELLSAEREATLGENLQRLVAAADGEVLAKFDDDDIYGEHYLSDALYALDYSGAALVGKSARYMHLANSGATVLMNPQDEHRYVNLVAGPTMVGARDTFLAHPFQHRNTGEDTQFQRDVLASGGTIYSADRFGFLQVRGASEHTWSIDDAAILANARVVAYADIRSHITI